MNESTHKTLLENAFKTCVYTLALNPATANARE
jgi:hypothetical protein